MTEKTREMVKKEVEKTMSSMNNIPEISAGPDFFNRVIEKMRIEDQGLDRSFWIFNRLSGSMRVALVTVLATANLISAVFFLTKGRNPDTRQQNLSSLMEEYSLVSSKQASDVFSALEEGVK